MRTEALIELLSARPEPVIAGSASRRLAAAVAAGAAVVLPVVILAMGLNPALAAIASLPMFWIKLAYAAALAGISLVATHRLARPGAPLGAGIAALLLPLAAMWLLGAWQWASADEAGRAALVFGATWRDCPLSIAALSVPLLLGLAWALKGLAPTRPALAGATAGFLAGAIAALVYALHCPELGAPFLGLWYPLGMLIPAVLGAALGPQLLRW